MTHLVSDLKTIARRIVTVVGERLLQWTQPLQEPPVGGAVSDVAHSKQALIAENALLRQQGIVLKRQVKQPEVKNRDRLLLVFLASKVRAWRQALLLIKPTTLLGWHRDLFRLVWNRKSAGQRRKPRVPAGTLALIKQMARDNRLWGAERIQGELRKLDIRLAKRTTQRYRRSVRPSHPGSQTWATFLKNHAAQVWACDFLPVIDFRFRQLYAFFIMELGSRRVVHVGVTRHPTDAWLAQQLREATPFDAHPKYLIRDNDCKFGLQFAQVAAGTGIKILKTPCRAPKANAFCERFLGSVRRECLNHFLVFGERPLRHILKAYLWYFYHARPHQGLGQRIPVPLPVENDPKRGTGQVQSSPILGGLHHRYQLAA